MKIREILEDLVKEANESLDKKDGMSISNVKSISQAESQIKKEIEGIIPEPKQVRYETNERKMGLDGVIITTKSQIKYDKEAEAYNQAISDFKRKLEER